MLRSILGFFMDGKGTRELHLGHLGLFFIIKTYDKQPGHPAAIGEDNFSTLSSSWASLMEDDEDEYEGEGDERDDDFQKEVVVRFLIGSFSALSRADFTLSRVHTLW